MHLDLDVEALKKLDPLSILSKIIEKFPIIEKKRSEVYTILAELCSNALDHGILRLDSSLKHSMSGMALYYEDRARKLEALTEGFIHMDIEFTPNKEDPSIGTLSIALEDSGPGFQYQEKVAAQKDPNAESLRKLSGRGMSLMTALCHSVEYKGCGNQVKVVYAWNA